MTPEEAAKEAHVAEQTETTLRRGIEILFVLGSDEALESNGLRVTRIAQLLGGEKSQVSRTLRTLLSTGVTERDEDTLQYRLSQQLLGLAARAADHRLWAVAPAFLERLTIRLGETSHLSVLQGAEVLTVLTNASPQVVSAAGWVGRTVPAYCTSSGRALLFDHDGDRLKALFTDVEFVRLAPNTPDNLDEFARRLGISRELGFAHAEEEHESGLVALAVPIRDCRGQIIAAINVSAPHYRLADRIQVAATEIMATANEISLSLGAPAKASL